MLKYSPLAEVHAELDAKMIPFQGWSVPAGYPGGAVAEHRHTRKYCSVFDYSFCGKIRVAGKDCAKALDEVLFKMVSPLEPGSIQTNYLLDDNGSFIDAVTIFRMAEDDCFIITNAVNTAKVLEHFSKLLPQDITVQDLTEVIARIDIQGPESVNVLAEAEVDVQELPGSGNCKMIEIAGIRCIAGSMEPCGERGFELFCGADNAIDLWDELTCIEPVRPAGVSAFDSLRIEMGYPAWCSEITPELSPLDLAMEIPQKKFSGSKALLNREKRFKIIYAMLNSRQTAKNGDTVKLESGTVAGVVTSGTQAPSLDHACVICRVQAQCDLPAGTKIILQSEKTAFEAVVCDAPFYKK